MMSRVRCRPRPPAARRPPWRPADGPLAFAIELQVVDLGSRSDGRGAALACRLTNRSAFPLFAIAARASGPTVLSSSRVRITLTPSRDSSSARSRRATSSVSCFSCAPAAPRTPVVASVPGVDDDRLQRCPRRQEHARIHGRTRWSRRAGRRGRFGALGDSALGLLCRHVDGQARHVVGGAWDRADRSRRASRSTDSVFG